MREWRSVVGYEGLYEVSNDGEVESLDRIVRGRFGNDKQIGGRRLAGGLSIHGYRIVVLSREGARETRAVHRLVLEAFVGPRPLGMECRHLNRRKTDNRWPQNIRWGTRAENESDKRRHGTVTIGSKNGYSVLVEEEVQDIRALFREGYGTSEIARLYRVTPSCISLIRCGKAWRHVRAA